VLNTGNRIEQRGVGPGKDSAVGPDSQRQRKQRSKCKAARFGQSAQTVLKITQQAFHGFTRKDKYFLEAPDHGPKLRGNLAIFPSRAEKFMKIYIFRLFLIPAFERARELGSPYKGLSAVNT
jgi:hypothetical protein